MSKMAELDIAVTELQRCGESLIRVSDALRLLFSGTEQQQTESTVAPEGPVVPEEPVAKELTLEDVRSVLAKKSVEGHTAAVQALIRKYGADKLSQVDPAYYTDLLRAAEAL